MIKQNEKNYKRKCRYKMNLYFIESQRFTDDTQITTMILK